MKAECSKVAVLLKLFGSCKMLWFESGMQRLDYAPFNKCSCKMLWFEIFKTI